MKNDYIMIIDDDIIEHKKLQYYFKSRSIDKKLVGAFDGEEGYDYLIQNKHHLPRLILLDLRMPKIDGLELLKMIKEDHILKRIPVVVFSTSNSAKDRLETFDNQVAGYMVKPTSNKEYEKIMDIVKSYWETSERAF